MQNRYATSVKYDVPMQDIAAYEVGGSIAILVNTVPASFWTLLYIFSFTPETIRALREEIKTTVVTETGDGNGKVNIIDLTALKTSYPLLTSTFQEVLRCRSMETSIRQVMEDTLLDGQWLLKKDSLIQIPSLILHGDKGI